jgi:hypothetical protein
LLKKDACSTGKPSADFGREKARSVVFRTERFDFRMPVQIIG